MIRVIDYKKRTQSETGKEFFSLILQGSPEILRSASNKPYITARRCSIPSTFDERTCKSLIGSSLPGRIVKVETDEPYEYTIPETGEKILLQHTFSYVEDTSPEEVIFEGKHF